MRVLHTSDWHLGRSFHGAGLLDDQRTFIDWLVPLVAAQGIDLTVIAGDIFDRAVPPVDAVQLWQGALERLSAIAPVLVIAGNHDSATRLGFAGSLLDRAGVHLRTDRDSIAEPVIVRGRDDVEVAAYGIPYLEPDLHREAFGVERSHAAVLEAAMDLVRADLADRPGLRSLVAAHAFITGAGEARQSDSERDLRVGGVGDAPASVLAGVDYAALGHLHGAQTLTAPGDVLAHYSGSPVAFSFSEESHSKAVTIVDIPALGPVTTTLVPVPVPRPLVTLTGRLEDLLADPDLAQHSGSWVRVRLTDPRRPAEAMARLRERWPYAVELTFESATVTPDTDAVRATAMSDPLQIAEAFVEHVTATPASDEEVALLQTSVEAVRISAMRSNEATR